MPSEFPGDFTNMLTALKTITESKISILGMQESESNIFHSLGNFVKDDFRNNFYEPSFEESGDRISRGGYSSNAILSHYEISSPSHTKFKTQPSEYKNFDGQSYTHCVIVFGGGKTISLYNTHLWYKGSQSEEEYKITKGQCEELLAVVNADTHPYKVIMGDWNIIENDPSSIGHDMLDMWKNSGYKLVNDGKYGTVWGSKAVDDIIVSQNITISNSGMQDCVLSTGGIDHNLLWADILLV